MRKLKIKIFADGAKKEEMINAYRQNIIRGFTTNTTLMRQCGVYNYKEFAQSILKEIPDMPISFEVFADDIVGMEREAREIASWGSNVYVKIPVTNTAGHPTTPVIQKLSNEGIKLNITAITTLEQVKRVVDELSYDTPSIVSVFAGRIADTGIDPVPIMRHAVAITKYNRHTELLWASPRELLNIVQAEECDCDIITVTPDLLKKLHLLGKDLTEYSLDTVKMFRNDAVNAGYRI
ncbi:MAG: transaldolase [Pedobacter sp.]|uniref:transaldolase n=1 Tax=Pedobacter sp. TaxID=1411316 RepID=UPI003568AF19